MELYNGAGDTLHFNFSLGINDSSLVYDNGSDKYFIKYTGTQLENVFSVQDSIKIFNMMHYDAQGNVIGSNLHGFQIKLGKSLGLVSFFDTYHFPQVETIVQLRGQLSPSIGNYQMKNEELFDWHVGDILQYRGYFKPANAYFSSTHYRTITITDRVENANTISIYYTESSFLTHNFPSNYPTPIPSYNVTYPNPIVITKNADLLNKPYNKAFTENTLMKTYTETNSSYCGTDKYSVLMSGAFLMYCDSCRCFGPVDGFGNSFPIVRYTKGLGHTKTSQVYYGPPGSIPYVDAVLHYYHVNGEECGTRAYMGMSEYDEDLFKFSPNPATDFIQTNMSFESVVIYDLHGKKIYVMNKSGNTIDISDIAPGIYIIEFSVNHQLIKRKLIKSKYN